MSKVLTLRIKDELYAAVERLQKQERRQYINEMGTLLLVDGLEANGVIHFNRACMLLAITGLREEFSQWRQANDMPAYAMLEEWKNYLEAFDTDGDAQDLHNTQNDALGVPQ